jgi:hypothetical protein
MTTLDTAVDNAPGRQPDHKHEHEHEGHGESDAVRDWVTARLSEAPPLTTEQLQRLRLLLGVEQLPGMKSA